MNYKPEADSFSGSIIETDDNSADKSSDGSNYSDGSDSELFSKKAKKRKLNSSRIDSSLLHVLESIDPTEEENEYRLQRQKNMQDRFKILGYVYSISIYIV